MKGMNKIAALVSAAALAGWMMLPALADDDPGLPDVTRTGSISVTVKDSRTSEPVAGGQITVYQVATVEATSTGYAYVYTDDFDGCGYSFSHIEDDVAQLAKSYASYVTKKSITGDPQTVDANGQVHFNDLQTGLYLVVQTERSGAYTVLDPFIVTIPMISDNEYVYDVDATPKTGTVMQPLPPGTNEQPSPSPGVPTPTPTSALPNVPGTSELPQTGQLWWPVPVLASLGTALILVGWMQRKNG